MSFFMDSTVSLGTKLLEIMYIIMGLVTIYVGIKNAMDKENPSRVGTAIFWCSLGIVLAFGRWIPAKVDGVLIIIMTIPAIFKKVKIGKQDVPDSSYTKKAFEKIGMKVFIPALSIGICAIIFAIWAPKLGALVGIGVGVLVAIIMLMLFSKKNTPRVFLKDSERLISIVGPLSNASCKFRCSIYSSRGWEGNC
jgi:uncharacterized membrane protein